MAGKLIHLRVPDVMYRQMKSMAKEFGFSSMQEYVKSAVRAMNQEYTRRRALQALEKGFGSVKAKRPRLTKEERQKLFEEFKPGKSNVLRQYGLD